MDENSFIWLRKKLEEIEGYKKLFMKIYSHNLLNNFLNKYFIRRKKLEFRYKKFIPNVNLQWEKKKKIKRKKKRENQCQRVEEGVGGQNGNYD